MGGVAGGRRRVDEAGGKLRSGCCKIWRSTPVFLRSEKLGCLAYELISAVRGLNSHGDSFFFPGSVITPFRCLTLAVFFLDSVHLSKRRFCPHSQVPKELRLASEGNLTERSHSDSRRETVNKRRLPVHSIWNRILKNARVVSVNRYYTTAFETLSWGLSVKKTD